MSQTGIVTPQMIHSAVLLPSKATLAMSHAQPIAVTIDMTTTPAIPRPRFVESGISRSRAAAVWQANALRKRHTGISALHQLQLPAALRRSGTKYTCIQYPGPIVDMAYIPFTDSSIAMS
jgi:hypothetical protein